jgi:hypothetical protein
MKSRSSASFTAELKDFIAPASVNINNCQPVTVKLKKVDQAGVTLSGAVMQLLSGGQPIAPDGAPLGTTTCTTASTADPATDGIGNCIFTLDTAQLVIGHEVTPPNGYAPAPDLPLEVVPCVEAQTIVLTFEDQVVPGRIVVQKHDDATNRALAGATFALLSNKAPAHAAPVDDDWPALATCTTDATGECSFVNLPLGLYFVVETAAPAGYFLADPAFQPATIHLGGAPGTGETVRLDFGNPPKFHTIVIVCQTATNALYSSAVSLDGAQPQMSITPEQAAAAGFGDPSALCRITQAQFGDKKVGNNSGAYSVTIPQSLP